MGGAEGGKGRLRRGGRGTESETAAASAAAGHSERGDVGRARFDERGGGRGKGTRPPLPPQVLH